MKQGVELVELVEPTSAIKDLGTKLASTNSTQSTLAHWIFTMWNDNLPVFALVRITYIKISYETRRTTSTI